MDPKTRAMQAHHLLTDLPRLPGWQLPLNHHERAHYDLQQPCLDCGFPNSNFRIYDQAKFWEREALTVLERRMIELTNKITDKPRWYEKVFDPKIVSRWTNEAKALFEAEDRKASEQGQTLLSLVWKGTEGADEEQQQRSRSQATHESGEAGDERSSGVTQTSDEQSGGEGEEDGADAAEGTDESQDEREDEDEDMDLFARLELETEDALTSRNEYYQMLPQPMSDKALHFCFEELKHKARRWQEHGIVFAIGLGGADILKSDSVIPEAFRVKFASLVNDLEASLEVDWHPGQEGIVRDLVHPSLYPLHYGHSRVTSTVVQLENCNDHIGDGKTLFLSDEIQKGEPRRYPDPDDPFTSPSYHWQSDVEKRKIALQGYSLKFQWLPAEVLLRGGEPAFTSYINNLEYPRHSQLYQRLAELIQYSIPLWDRCIAKQKQDSGHRRHDVVDEGVLWGEDGSTPVPPAPPKFFWNDLYVKGNVDDEEINEAWEERWELFHRKPRWPEPPTFKQWIESNPIEERQIDLVKDYQNLQVIVKLANIELTPGNPQYTGGSWHVEGLANEHICATSIFYYDSDNVSESKIQFRCGGYCEPDYNYPQNEFQGLERMYGTDLRDDAPALLDLGMISTPQGRLLAFPNVFQHRVHPFELVDQTKPGHRKIAVLWLVNPQKRIISTAHVPPQQREKHENLVRDATVPKIPAEIGEMIVNDAIGHLDTAAEAKSNRILLMEERQGPAEIFHEIKASYNFCEH